MDFTVNHVPYTLDFTSMSAKAFGNYVKHLNVFFCYYRKAPQDYYLLEHDFLNMIKDALSFFFLI